MASALYSGISDALADAFEVGDQTFSWNGTSYGCIIDTGSATIVTSKALFSGAIPKTGDTVQVDGKNREVLSVDNASANLVPGGYVEPGTPYVDDNMSPAFSIRYGAFIRG